MFKSNYYSFSDKHYTVILKSEFKEISKVEVFFNKDGNNMYLHCKYKVYCIEYSIHFVNKMIKDYNAMLKFINANSLLK